MTAIDLTPFDFTPTESLVYATLLRLGPSTGYAVARGARLARANAYAALEGLVSRGAASRQPPPGRPARYRPTDPTALLAHLATLQGEALDHLSRALRDSSAAAAGEPTTRAVSGSRAVANLILQLVARAEQRVDGVLAAELWRPTLPAWRRAAARATLAVKVAGDAPTEAEGLATGSVGPDEPTLLVIDEARAVVTKGTGDRVAGLWTSHPLLVDLARRAIRTLA